MENKIREFGLIGHPVAHSFSPDFFAKKFESEHISACYRAFDLENINDFPALLELYPSLEGLNVTIPHKESVIPYLDQLSIEAERIGAVNCISIRDGKLAGYNTDWLGFQQSLEPLLKDGMKALVLGNGGASKAVQFALTQMDIPFLLIVRRQNENAITYEDLNEAIMQDHLVIINTTPLGMHPFENEMPALPYSMLTASHVLYDLVYNPAETRFLREGKSKGCVTKNGYEMLVLQAEASWKIWKA